MRDGRVAAGGEEDFLGADGLFAAVVEDDFGFVFGEQVRAAVEIFNFVILEVLLVDAVQPSDVGIALVLKGGPIEGSGRFDGEAVGG